MPVAADPAPLVQPIQPPPRPALSIYVDAIPDMKYTDLQWYVDEMNKFLCEKFDLADVRLADEKSKLGYGRWRGLITEMVRASPPPPGVYVLHTRGSEVAAEIATGLRYAATLFCRGV